MEIRESESAIARGHMIVATHTIQPGWYDEHGCALLSNAEILARLTEPDGQGEGDNIMCMNGLSILVQSINWSAIEDQNVNFGSPFTATFLAPLWGAIGTGSTAVANSDVQLTTEVNRGVAGAGGTTAASSGVNPTVSWLFLLTAPASTIVIAEAGVFAQGTAAVNSGQLLDHTLVSPTVTQLATQLVTLSVTLTIGN